MKTPVNFEDYFRRGLIRCHIPEHMHQGVINYLVHGVPPGGFLEAVLTNNLTESVGRADEANQAAIIHWAMWLYNEAPCEAWGSDDAIQFWIERMRRKP